MRKDIGFTGVGKTLEKLWISSDNRPMTRSVPIVPQFLQRDPGLFHRLFHLLRARGHWRRHGYQQRQRPPTTSNNPFNSSGKTPISLSLQKIRFLLLFSLAEPFADT